MYEALDVQAHRRGVPSALLSLAELPRTLLEVASFTQIWPLLAQASRGDGHPVLVLPGFMVGDASTLLLRRLLDRLGYETIPWRLGRNTGSTEIQRKTVRRFLRLTRTSRQPLSVIGQSLGGIFARELARRYPEHVRSVITLASPFRASDADTTNPLVRRLFETMSGLTPDNMRERFERHEDPRTPLPVPSTAIYSKTDGVVAWEMCLESDAPRSENVEIIGSHSGMAINPAALHVIADRLAQPSGAWQRFDRRRGYRAWFYPEPSYAPAANATSV